MEKIIKVCKYVSKMPQNEFIKVLFILFSIKVLYDPYLIFTKVYTYITP